VRFVTLEAIEGFFDSVPIKIANIVSQQVYTREFILREFLPLNSGTTSQVAFRKE
jgi:hypothetical protein